MSKEYDEYLKIHRNNVVKGLDWFEKSLPGVVDLVGCIDLRHQIEMGHDFSKDNADEYVPYDEWFYGNPSYEAKQAYEKAWLLHIHRNPHHWQYWVLIHDDPDEPTTCLLIPMNYIIEMICDWWAFSWQKGNLYEIFDWYKEHAPHIQMNDDSRELVEAILQKMKDKLDYDNTVRCGLEEDRYYESYFRY